MNPTDADWWWQYGFDGLIGALIGGAITAFAVVLTLRHERKLVDLQEARVVAGRLSGLAWQTSQELFDDRSADRRRAALALGGDVMELAARTRRRWPGLDTKLRDHLGDLLLGMTNEKDPTTMAGAAADLAALIQEWVEDPKSFETDQGRRSS